jgi:hypothetical protein
LNQKLKEQLQSRDREISQLKKPGQELAIQIQPRKELANYSRGTGWSEGSDAA